MIALAASTETPPSPFHDAALDLPLYGLAIMPCRTRDSDDGKHKAKGPLLSKFNLWKRPPGQEAIRKWMGQFSEANIGAICGLSGVTVVDVDGGEELVAEAIAMFGDTPLKTQTPSGGMHLWYRHNGERNRNLRTSHGLDIDIKGRGGYVLIPPSIRIDGPYAGQRYKFVTGSWDDLLTLPAMKSMEAVPSFTSVAQAPSSPTSLRAVQTGWRNTTLQKLLLRKVRQVDDLEDLIDSALSINGDFPDPLPNAEVEKTARSVWNLEVSGNNWVGRGARIEVTMDNLDSFGGDADALMLDIYLRLQHGARPEPFAVSAKAMAQAKVIPGWGTRRIDAARRKLVEIGALHQKHQGGKKRGDPSQFTLSSHTGIKGARKAPNINKHPPPLSPPPPPILIENEVGRRQQLGLNLVGGAGRPRRIDPVMFGRVVRQQREQQGLSQAQVAAMSGMSRSGVGNIETGTFPASPKTQHHLADLLGIDLGVAA
jgi:DNA-binding XRE family transcriptional regulator